MTKSESIAVRVTPTVKKAVEKAARAQQQTIAGFIEDILVNHLGKEGYLREAPPSREIAG